MPIDRELLSLLVCPTTKVAVKPLDAARLHKLNRAIREQTVALISGAAITNELQEALVTEDGRTIYRIDDGVPIMLEDEAIATAQLADWS